MVSEKYIELLKDAGATLYCAVYGMFGAEISTGIYTVILSTFPLLEKVHDIASLIFYVLGGIAGLLILYWRMFQSKHEARIKELEADYKRLDMIAEMDQAYGVAEVTHLMTIEEYDALLDKLEEKYKEQEDKRKAIQDIKKRLLENR